MYPTRLILKNFGPFEELDYSFTKEPIAVIGENRTQDDQLSNGTGKSFYNQGLFYGIYGTNLRDKQDKKLIRKGFDTAYVCVFIYCPIRKQTLRIDRELRTKGSSTLTINIMSDGEEDWTRVPVTTVLEGNRYITDWIEISAEDAKSYYIVSKGNYNSFFKSSNTEKLALISRFINFSMLDKTKSIIEEEVNKINEKKRVHERELSSYEGKLSVYMDQLQEILDSNPEAERDAKLKDYEQDIFDCENKIKELNLEYVESEIRIKNLDKEIDKIVRIQEDTKNELLQIDTSNFDEVFNEINEELKSCKDSKKEEESNLELIQGKISNIKKVLNKLEVMLSGVIVCPRCGYEFFLDEEKTPEIIESEKKEKELELENELKNKENVNESITEIDNVIQEYAELKKETDEEFDKVVSQQRELKRTLGQLDSNVFEYKRKKSNEELLLTKIQNEIEHNKTTISLVKNSIDELKKTELKKKDTKKLEELIDECNDKIAVLGEEVVSRDSEIFKVQQWVQRFKDFKMYLAMEQLKNIQSRANEILKLMGSDLRLIIEGFKTTSKGEIKEEITPYVFRDEIESFFYYSGGEQARTEISLILAIQQMINSTKKYGGLQFLLVDEVLESADSLGIENIISSLKFLKQSSLIVTHVPKINEEISQIKIIKENGVSRLEQ